MIKNIDLFFSPTSVALKAERLQLPFIFQLFVIFFTIIAYGSNHSSRFSSDVHFHYFPIAVFVIGNLILSIVLKHNNAKNILAILIAAQIPAKVLAGICSLPIFVLGFPLLSKTGLVNKTPEEYDQFILFALVAAYVLPYVIFYWKIRSLNFLSQRIEK